MKLKSIILASITLLLSTAASTATITSPVMVNLDGATLHSNGVDYTIDPSIWTGTLTTNDASTDADVQFNVSPTIVGYETATNDFPMTIIFFELDGITTSSLLLATMAFASSSIPNAEFDFNLTPSFGAGSNTWNWVGFDLVFQIDYAVPDDPFNRPLGSSNYGTYNFTIENFFDTYNVSAVPIPAATWLFISGLLSMVGLARRKTE